MKTKIKEILKELITLRRKGIAFNEATKMLRKKGLRFNQNEIFKYDKKLRKQHVYLPQKPGRKPKIEVKISETTQQKIIKNEQVKKLQAKIEKKGDMTTEMITTFLKKQNELKNFLQYLKDSGYKDDFLLKKRTVKKMGFVADKRIIEFYNFLREKNLFKKFKEFRRKNYLLLEIETD